MFPLAFDDTPTLVLAIAVCVCWALAWDSRRLHRRIDALEAAAAQKQK